jgi:carboxypeptidase family protein
MILKSCSLLVSIALSVCLIRAQEVTGNLEGRVLDSKGTPISGVTASVTGASLQGERGISSDNDGFFRLLSLPSGRYTLQLRHLAFLPKAIHDVRIRLGTTTTVGDAVLEESTVDMPEVVISGHRPLLDPLSTTSGANLDRQEFEVLPMERNYRSIATILPHANQSYFGDEVNIAGSSGLENRYFVNGNEVTDAMQGLGGINLPYNFIREIEVKTGGYEPEYKSSLGGILNVVTYSGGNDFSGQVFGFFTNNNFGGEQRLASTEPPKGAFAQYDIGFTLGGPILRDELWFFGAYSPLSRNEDIKLPGLSFYPDEQRTHSFAGKLTWKAADALDISATLLGDPTTRNVVGAGFGVGTVLNMVNPDPFLYLHTTGGYGVFIDAQHRTGKNLYLQGSLSFIDGQNKSEPRTEAGKEPFYLDYATSTASGGFGGFWNTTNTVIEGRLSATLISDQHEIKTGVAYREVAAKSEGQIYDIFKFDDATYLSLLNIAGGGTIKNRVPSAFIQDVWSLSRSLRITGGLRWDGLFIIAPNGQLTSRVLGQHQPRLGVVFAPGGDQSRKLFASIGRYAEDLLVYGSAFYQGGSKQVGLNYNHDPRVDPTGYDTAFVFQGSIPPDVQDLHGQYYDEATIGYEQLLSEDLKITTRGTYRLLRQILEDAQTASGTYYGNPGEEPLTDYPFPRRDYLSLELTLEKSWGSKLNLLASYVLSRNYGNYVGLYDQDINAIMPNVSPQFDFPDLFTNSTGLLPNDRTHVFKVNASYRFDFGLTCATSFFWETGTPLSEFSGSHGSNSEVVNLVPRGSAGRLPSLWDLDLRFTYGMPSWNLGQLRPRLILDIFHVASQKEVVMQDQVRYNDLDASGNPVFPNPGYGLPTRFQPPMSVRVGMEVNF